MKTSVHVAVPCVGLLSLALSFFGLAATIESKEPVSPDYRILYQPSPEEAAAEQLYWAVHCDLAHWFLFQDRLTNLRLHEIPFRNTNDAEVAINAELKKLGDDYTRYDPPARAENSRASLDRNNSVFVKLLDGNVGYIRITQFSRPTTTEVSKALDELPSAISIILDLRGNPGGMMHVGFHVFSLFVDTGVFAYTDGYVAGQSVKQELRVDKKLIVLQNGLTHKEDRLPNKLGKRRVIVLIDGNTASAAEMLALGLRDNGIATTMGTQSFGKGVGQSVFQLPNGGQLTLTAFRTYSPKKVSIHKLGIIPDQTVKNVSGGDDQFNTAYELLRSNTSAGPNRRHQIVAP